MDWNYYIVFRWMRTALGLSGNELNAFALVYSYSQDGQGCYFGSLATTADMLGVTVQTAVTVLKKLQERGYVDKTESISNGVKTCSYRPTQKILEVLKNFERGTQKFLEGGTQKFLDNNKDIDNKSIIKTSTNPLTPFREFVSLKEEEYAKLVADFGKADADRLLDILNNYKGSTGKKYKSDYLAIRSWCVDRLHEQQARERRGSRSGDQSVASWAAEMYKKFNGN